MSFIEANKVVHYAGKNTPEGYTGTCRAVRDADLREAAAAISRPTLVLCGDQELATPPDLAQKLAGAVAGAEFCLIEGAAPIACVEQPELFSRRMMDFREGISGA